VGVTVELVEGVDGGEDVIFGDGEKGVVVELFGDEGRGGVFFVVVVCAFDVRDILRVRAGFICKLRFWLCFWSRFEVFSGEDAFFAFSVSFSFGDFGEVFSDFFTTLLNERGEFLGSEGVLRGGEEGFDDVG